MSYSLELYFEPAVRRGRMLQYFAARKYFSVQKGDVLYKNMDTGVYFFMKLRCARNILFQRTVVSAEFEINYYRPSYFGIEAERELSAFMAAFQPRIDDPQIHGMGEGPYSGEAFLNAWNIGNRFSIRSALSRDPDVDIPSMPANELRTTWEWNDRRAERIDMVRDCCIVPTIMLVPIEGRLSRLVVWPMGMSILLPRADYVLVGRIIFGEKRFGLARWSEAQEVAGRAGFDTMKDPLEIAYFVTPPPIANWARNIPLIDPRTLRRLSPERVLDDELIAAARESIERDRATQDGASRSPTRPIAPSGDP